MKKVFLLTLLLLLLLICATALADMQEGLYTYQINNDNTVTITGFDWENNHGDIYIPEMLGNRIVSAIGEKAFSTTRNSAVKITLPDNIRSIREQAFRGVSITYINIPLNTVEIGGGAFAQCNVMRFNVANGHTVFATIENALYNKQTKTLIAWPENKDISEIPKGIKNIGDYAFYGRIGYFNLPDSVIYIGKYAFGRDEENSLYFGETLRIKANRLQIIDDYAFFKTSVNFENVLSLSHIGKYAFSEGAVVFKDVGSRVRISKTPFSVDDYAFYDCKINYSNGLAYDLIKLTNIKSIGESAFATRYFRLVIEKYDFKNLVYIGKNAFRGQNHYMNELLDVDLSVSSVEKISAGVFRESKLRSIVLNPTIQSIGEDAFSSCLYLNEIDIPEGVHTIEDRAFEKCRSLTSAHIPASVTMIGNDVFKDCSPKLIITVEAGSYGEVWARTCGYAYKVNGVEEDTSWLEEDTGETQDEKVMEQESSTIGNENVETYSATAHGFGGEVTVTLTLDSNNKVIDASIDGYYETPGLGGAAITFFTDYLKGKELPNVNELDIFSGATVTSEAIIQALQEIEYRYGY